MSFAEKIAGLMNRPNQQPGPMDDQPWYLKNGVRVLGMVGGFFFILLGFFNALGIILFKVSCLLSGISQIVMGFILMAVEAPCCFFYLDHVGKLAEVVDARPLWFRAPVYIAFAIIPLFICFGITDLLASLLIFACGAGYGVMGLGKKASAEDMRQAAVNSGFANSAGQPASNDRAGIINNAQPFSFTGAVGTDSNV